MSSCVVLFFAICILQHLFGSHKCIHYREDFTNKQQRERCSLYQNNQMCSVHLTRPSLARLGRTSINSLCEESRLFSPFSVQGFRAMYISELLQGPEVGKEGREVLTYGRPVIPGPAQPKTVTVCLCLPCGHRGTIPGQGNGSFQRP